MKRVVVVVPTYNEEDNVVAITKAIVEQSQKQPGYDIHALVSDSHSPDKTFSIAQKLSLENDHIHAIDVVERGIGVGIVKGFEYAVSTLGADVLMMIDADLSHDPSAIPSFLKEIDNGHDLVIGSRYKKGGANNLSIHRQFFSLMANTIIRIMVRMIRISEFTTSYRAVTVDLYRKINFDRIPWKSRSFVFQPAFVYEAALVARNISEVPIIFSDRRKGRSKMQTAQYIYEVLKYCALTFKERYKTFIKFCVVGLSGTAVDMIALRILVGSFGFEPFIGKIFSTAAGIINNFTWNNAWTFKSRQNQRPMHMKFILYAVVSFGGMAIGSIVMLVLTSLFGNEHYLWLNLLTIPPQMAWNFLMNHFVTWKKSPAVEV